MEAYPIALFTDQEVDHPVFDRVLRCSYPSNSYVDKIEGMLACPFDRAIFLDTDTHICGSIKGLFDLLTRFDLAVAHSSWRFSPPLVDGSVSDGAYIGYSCPTSFCELNTGVLTFTNSPQVRGFFRYWLATFREQTRQSDAQPWHDQPSFRVALWHSSIRAYILPTEFNYRADFPGAVGTAVRIVHGRHPRLAEIGRRLNEGAGARVFVPGEFKMFEWQE